MLKIDKLTKYYGKTKGVENLSLELKKGEIFGFIGPNGAGKSTTIRSVMGMIKKDSGEIYIDGRTFNNKDDINEMIGYLPSEVNLYETFTVKQMLLYNDSFYEKDCMKKAKELLKKLDLDCKKKIDELSLGNLKKLGIILTLMHNPKLIIMDEATSGLDPLMQETFYEILKEEQKQGATIFFSSHNLNEVKKICDRIGVIKEGHLIEIKDADKIIDDSLLKITIKSKKVKEIEKDIKANAKIKENNMVFTYQEDINKLIKILSKYDVDSLLIEEPSIEEVFMHYYK